MWAAKIPPMTCPSSTPPATFKPPQVTSKNYFVCLGDAVKDNRQNDPMELTRGAFKNGDNAGQNSSGKPGINMAEIIDGTSTTVAMSERIAMTDKARVRTGGWDTVAVVNANPAAARRRLPAATTNPRQPSKMPAGAMVAWLMRDFTRSWGQIP